MNNRWHQASSVFMLIDTIANQTISIYPLAMVMPSASSMAEALKYIKADASFIGPLAAVDIAKNPELLGFLAKNLEVIIFGGADLPKVFGDLLSSQFKFWNSNGSTETGAWPLIHQEGQWFREDWQYLYPHPATGIQFRPLGDKYEAVIVRNSNAEDEQPVFKLFPNLQEFHTKDLFSPHPTKSGFWMFQGRADDIIILTNGQMCDPKLMEHAVTGMEQIRHVVMLGNGKDFPVLLLELKSDASAPPIDQAVVIEELWPTIKEANKFYRTNSGISKSAILIVDSARPLPLAAKGSIQRGPSLDLYKEELSRLWGEYM